MFNCKYIFEGCAVNGHAHSQAKFSHSLGQGRHICLAQPHDPNCIPQTVTFDQQNLVLPIKKIVSSRELSGSWHNAFVVLLHGNVTRTRASKPQNKSYGVYERESSFSAREEVHESFLPNNIKIMLRLISLL